MSCGPKKRVLSPKSLWDEAELRARCDELGILQMHVGKLYHGLLSGKQADEIAGLPRKLVALVGTEFLVETSRLIESSLSADGSTTKVVIELQDGNRVEAVIMRYGAHELKNFPQPLDKRPAVRDGERSFKSKPRCTLCVSSQVGCAMGCTFCATGTMQLLANLTAGEILEQLWHANKLEKIKNVVFMGMGEPLDNYDNVLAAIRGMVDVQRFRLKHTHVCISTVGVVPRMRTLARDAPGVALALSLHAPTQELRQQIVPTSKAWPVHKLIAAMDQYVADSNYLHSRAKQRTKMMIEYVLIDHVNDSLECAAQLGELLKDRHVVVNVIPYNPTDVPYDYKTPSIERADAFVAKVREYGLMCLLRQTMGDDVSGACGQLVLDVKKRDETSAAEGSAAADASEQRAAKGGEIEDLLGGSSGGKKKVVRRRANANSAVADSKLAQASGDIEAGHGDDERPAQATIFGSPLQMALLVLASVPAFFLVRKGVRLALSSA